MSVKDLKTLGDNELDGVAGGQSCTCHPSTGPCPLHGGSPKPGDSPGGPGPSGTTTVTDTIYIIKKGETLGGIAAQFGTTVAKLKEWNNIVDVNKIYEGKKLVVKRV